MGGGVGWRILCRLAVRMATMLLLFVRLVRRLLTGLMRRRLLLFLRLVRRATYQVNDVTKYLQENARHDGESRVKVEQVRIRFVGIMQHVD